MWRCAAASDRRGRGGWYTNADGDLDLGRLLAAFQQFYRENSEHWVERQLYKNAGPQLLSQEFLQRVVNSGGRIGREYGLGRGRADLLVTCPAGEGVQRFVVECKVLRGGLEPTIRKGFEKTASYMERCGADECHLVTLDRGESPWERKLFRRR